MIEAEIFRMLKRIEHKLDHLTRQQEVIIMQGLTDLQNNVGQLVNVVGQVKSSISALNSQIASLQATIAAGGDNDADVEAQAQAVADQVSILNGLVNPPATPAA